MLRRRIAVGLCLSLLFDRSTPLYGSLYDAGLIDEDFGGGYTAERGFAYAAVVEGSGTQAMQQWAMRNAGQLSLQDLEQAGSMGATELAAAPPYLWKPLIAAYMQGQQFLAGGRKVPYAVRRAFEKTPRSSEQVLHPEKFLEGKDPPVTETDPLTYGCPFPGFEGECELKKDPPAGP